MDRTKEPAALTPFIAGAAANLLEVLQAEDYFTRTLIEHALTIAEADAAEVAAASVSLTGDLPIIRLQKSADEALLEIGRIGESTDRDRPIETMNDRERAYIVALARLAELAGRDAPAH